MIFFVFFGGGVECLCVKNHVYVFLVLTFSIELKPRVVGGGLRKELD